MYCKWKNCVLITSLIAASAVVSNLFAQNLDTKVANAWTFADMQMKATLQELADKPDKYPKITSPEGGWILSNAGTWTSGFYPGCLWMMYAHTQDNAYLQPALDWTDGVAGQANNTGNHDVGFQLMGSFGKGLSFQSDQTDYKQTILTGAGSLSTRFHETVGAIRSWSWGVWRNDMNVIIDNMMNLELLFWAAENGGSNILYQQAVSHAHRTRMDHVRADHSTYHVILYNEDGTVKEKTTHQGVDAESTWSRGQAWGVYGFTMVYRFTQNDTFLTVAKNLADYFIDNLPEDFIPYSDFEAPDIPNVSKDASAAAIVAAALFELSQYVQETKYYTAALNILESLIDNYLATDAGYESILKRCSQWYGDDERGTSYGDYYFLEALTRYGEAVTRIASEQTNAPMDFTFAQNYPNPFNPRTVVSSQLTVHSFAEINVYDSAGKFVKCLFSGFQSPGYYESVWDGKDQLGRAVGSGVYICRLQTENSTQQIKMMLVR